MNRVMAQSQKHLREGLKIALPIMVSHFILMMSGFISNLMLSRINGTVFAAGLLINATQLLLVMVVFGLFYALSPLMSLVVGEGRQLERVGHLFFAGCVVALIACAPIIALLYFIKPLLLILGQPLALAEACARYFHIYLWSVPAAGIVSVYVQLLLGTFKQGIFFLYGLGNLVVSSVLGYALIFGKFGFPALGLEGLAWALLITAWLAVLVFSLFILRHADYRVYALLAVRGIRLKQNIGRILRIGLPISVQMGNEIFSLFVTTIMVGWISIEALNIQQVVTRYLLMLVIPIVGLSQAATVVISRYFGAGELGEVKRIGQVYIGMALIYSLIVLLAFTFVPGPFIHLFIDKRPENALMIRMLGWILMLMAVGQVFDAARNILTALLRGVQDTQFPMQVSVVTIWLIGMPLAYVAGFPLQGGLIGFTVAHVVVMMLSCFILYRRWQNRLKKMR